MIPVGSLGVSSGCKSTVQSERGDNEVTAIKLEVGSAMKAHGQEESNSRSIDRDEKVQGYFRR